MSSYPAVTFMVKHGKWIAGGLSLAPLALAAWLLFIGAWGWAIVAVLAAPVLFLFLKSYMELVSLMSDMLIPK